MVLFYQQIKTPTLRTITFFLIKVTISITIYARQGVRSSSFLVTIRLAIDLPSTRCLIQILKITTCLLQNFLMLCAEKWILRNLIGNPFNL